MSNLKAQIKGIQQQLASSTAETLARFKRLETEIVERFQGLEAALQEQGQLQHSALEKLLDLVVDHTEELEGRMTRVEERVERLEGKPPAA